MDNAKIEIKGLKTFVGREGYGFNANLYVNGKKTAFIADDANGGPFFYEVFDKKVFGELSDYVKTLPSLKTEYGDLEMDMDLFLDDYIAKYEADKKLKNICKTKTAFSYDNGKTMYTISNKFSSTVKVYLMTKYGKDVIIYNEKF